MRLPTRLTAAALTAGLALALGACGSAAADPATLPPADLAADATISVVDNAFEPVHAGVPAGITVTWSWEGTSAQHNVVGEGFESPLQDSGTFAHTFDRAGTYAFRCTVHGQMRGAVTVAGA